MKKKSFALVIVLSLCISLLAGCGDKNEETKEPEVTPIPEVTQTVAPTEEAPKTDDKKETVPAGFIADFEDGNTGFVMVNISPVKADPDTVFELADYNGSKAIKVSGQNGKMVNYLGIDVSSLLGDKVTEVRSMEASMGLELVEGEFFACSGNIYTYTGENNQESATPWSVYLDSKNPKTIVADLADDVSFVSGAKNIVVIAKETDNAYAAKEISTSFYIDDLVFRDKDGNPIAVDTTVGFDAPDGFGGEASSGFSADAVDVMVDLDSGGDNVWQYPLTELQGKGSLKYIMFQLVGDFTADGDAMGGGSIGLNAGDDWWQVDYEITEDDNLIIIDIPSDVAEKMDYESDGIVQIGFWWGSDPVATLTKVEFSDGTASAGSNSAINPMAELDPNGVNVWQYPWADVAEPGKLTNIVFQLSGDFTAEGESQGGGSIGLNYGEDGWWQVDYETIGGDVETYIIDVPADVADQIDYESEGIVQIGYWWGSAPIATIVSVDFIMQ